MKADACDSGPVEVFFPSLSFLFFGTYNKAKLNLLIVLFHEAHKGSEGSVRQGPFS